jgi:hypothetical protein
MTEPVTTPQEWAIVEIMGHLRTAGRISEEDRFGAKLLRVDRPYTTGEDETIWTTSFHTGTAIYQLRLCSEETARITAQALGDPRPRNPSSPPAYLSYAPDDAPGDDDDDHEPLRRAFGAGIE